MWHDYREAVARLLLKSEGLDEEKVVRLRALLDQDTPDAIRQVAALWRSLPVSLKRRNPALGECVAVIPGWRAYEKGLRDGAAKVGARMQ
jgi:hypothetical protein